jgi:hypothetical protein
VGGCLTGEHGVGVEKRDLMAVQFAPADLEAQMRVKDVFDPRWLLNPPRSFRWRRARGGGGVSALVLHPQRSTGVEAGGCPPPAPPGPKGAAAPPLAPRGRVLGRRGPGGDGAILRPSDEAELAEAIRSTEGPAARRGRRHAAGGAAGLGAMC